MNPFAKYRIIKAEDIIKANIRPDHIPEDAASLLNALNSLTFIIKPEFPKTSGLHANLIQKLDAKPHTVDLLRHFGYKVDTKGNYTYQSTSTEQENTIRRNAADEFLKFYEDLKKIKDGALKDFQTYINSSKRRPQSSEEEDDVYQPQSQRPTSRPVYRPASPPPMPSFTKVREGNDKTAETIRSFKESIVPRHGGRPVHSFIRRKLLLLLFKQINPTAIEFGDEAVDDEIEQKVARLRQQDQHRDTDGGNEVYFECLIRANFHHQTALNLLKNNRPNLKPPPEPEQPRGPTTTTLASSMRHLQQHWQGLNANTGENGPEQMLLYEGDEWKNAVHIVPAITEVRQQHNNPGVNDLIFSKMYRLIYTELSKIIGRQSPLKIELFAYALCKVPPSTLQYLNMADIKDIMRSCPDTQIRDDFQDYCIRSLSTECPICADSFPRSRMETMFLCGHMCCVTCAKDYYRHAIKQIRDSGALKKLTCFQEEHEIAEDIKLNFFQYLGAKLNQWFTDERLILDAYQENLFHATRDSQTRKCGNPRCVGFFHINNTRVVRAQCPHCQFRQCQQCSRKWHDDHNGKDCEAYAEWLKDNDPDDPEVQLTKYLQTAGMMCPNEQCKAIYEYQAGGCEHFRCRECNTEFCRICSALFYNPARNTACRRANCLLKDALHAHCYLNCFREIRDAQIDEITGLLTTNNINYAEELRQKPVATGPVCPVEDCNKAPSVACENRFCEGCYKQFLCLFVWRNQIPPWDLYTDNNLRQKLIGASVAVPENAARPTLIQLAQQHLTPFLGKPKEMPRIRQQ